MWFLAAYVVPVKVEMEMVIEQYEKAKAVREEQLERLTQICQEQAVRRPSLHMTLTELKSGGRSHWSQGPLGKVMLSA